jgi:four helix bundle protein
MGFPDEEKYGIISQMRRAAYSVPSNIVEGRSRNTQKEFYQFLSIARGSIDELGYFILLAKDLKYIDHDNFLDLTDKCSHIGSMLNNLMKKIKS